MVIILKTYMKDINCFLKKSDYINSMKKFLALIILIFITLPFAPMANAEPDYEILYANAKEADFKFMHNVDPYQDEDNFKYAWSPYLLFRTSSTFTFKSSSIPAGYYLLTPRKHNGKNWILFKQQGKVQYIIPVLRTEVVEPGFYKTKVPKVKKNGWQKLGDGICQVFYKVFKSSKKQNPPDSYIEVYRYEGQLYLMKYYYGQTVYITLFRVE